MKFGGEISKNRPLNKMGHVGSNSSVSTMAPDDWDDESVDDFAEHWEDSLAELEESVANVEAPSERLSKKVTFVDKVEVWEITIDDSCQLFPVNRSSRVSVPKAPADDCCFRILKLGLQLMFFGA